MRGKNLPPDFDQLCGLCFARPVTFGLPEAPSPTGRWYLLYRRVDGYNVWSADAPEQETLPEWPRLHEIARLGLAVAASSGDIVRTTFESGLRALGYTTEIHDAVYKVPDYGRLDRARPREEWATLEAALVNS